MEKNLGQEQKKFDELNIFEIRFFPRSNIYHMRLKIN